jgi:hypothetical protein
VWHRLFGGPPTIQQLARHLNKEMWYSFLYSGWSDATHAGAVMANVQISRADPTGTSKAIRPLRNPEGLEQWRTIAAVMAIEVALQIKNKYFGAVSSNYFQDKYHRTLRPLLQEMGTLRGECKWY